MSHIQPREVASGPSNASLTTQLQSVIDMVCVRFQIEGLAASTPVGTLKLQGSEDHRAVDDANSGGSTATWTDLTLPAGSVHGTSAAVVFAGPAVTIAWDGTLAANILIDVANPPSYMRLVYTRASGGAAAARGVIVRVGMRGHRV